VAQWVLLVVVLMAPNLVHFGENIANNSRAPASPVSNDEIEERMRDMLPIPPAPPAFEQR